MLADHFPLTGLRLITPRLELRLPAPEELASLADLAAAGIHDPAAQPFAIPWTEAAPADAARSVILHHWRQLGTWTPEDWSLNLAVFRDGAVTGTQEIYARQLAVTREVSTGSWLGSRYQGQGIGTEMRAAVLELGFTGLGATAARSGAAGYNAASLAVSRKLGYRPDGQERRVVSGKLVTQQRLLLSREDWEKHRTVPVTIEGLAPCLPLLGLGAGTCSAAA